MCEIAWCSFSWEAFATLATGIGAVSAALIVGLKQMGISNRQIALENLKLRAELYDRRIRVYNATKDWFLGLLQEGKIPEDERRQAFIDAVYSAEFLFRDEVSEKLRQYYDKGIRHAMFQRNNQDDDAFEVVQELIEASNTLHDLFGPELRVGEQLDY